ALLNGSAGRTIELLQASSDEQLDEACTNSTLRDRRLLQSRGESLLVELAQVSAAEQRLGSQLDLADGVLTVNQRRHLLGENTLRLPLERSLGDLHGKAIDLLAVQEGEHAEELHHVGVGGVEEVLVPAVRARQLRIEPQVAATRGLAELLALGVRDQRNRQTVDRIPVHAADQVHTGDDVAPLIGATDLHADVVLAVQVNEVIRLQQHVGELGVGDAVGSEATLHGVAGKHRVQREVLAEVAQEVDDRHLADPVSVVDQRRGVQVLARLLELRTSLEEEESAQLLLDVLHVLGDLFLGQHGALAHVARVTDHAGGTTRQGESLVPG